MTMAKALAITIHLAPLAGPQGEEFARLQRIESALGTVASDWLRFNKYTYFVRTDRTPNQLYFHLKPQLALQDSILIVEVDLSPTRRFGQAMQWVWDWLNKYS